VLEIAFRHNAYLSGGAVRSIFTGDRIADLDISFRTKAEFDACTYELAEETDAQFTKTDAAWTHKPDKGPMIQLICALFGQPEDILAQYDFTVCMGAWIPGSQTFVLADMFLKHCAQRRLCYNANGYYPISTLWRTMKFVNRGYKLPGVEAIKLALAIHHLDLSTHAKLKQQLMGIDTLFLKEFTDALTEHADVAYDFGEAVTWLERYVDERAIDAFKEDKTVTAETSEE
jgi:hypothetical protein